MASLYTDAFSEIILVTPPTPHLNYAYTHYCASGSHTFATTVSGEKKEPPHATCQSAAPMSMCHHPPGMKTVNASPGRQARTMQDVISKGGRMI